MISSYGDFLNGLSERLRKEGLKLHDIPAALQYKLEIVASDTQLSTFRNSWCHVIMVTISDSPSIDYVKQFSDCGWNFSQIKKLRLVEETPRL